MTVNTSMRICKLCQVTAPERHLSCHVYTVLYKYVRLSTLYVYGKLSKLSSHDENGLFKFSICKSKYTLKCRHYINYWLRCCCHSPILWPFFAVTNSFRTRLVDRSINHCKTWVMKFPVTASFKERFGASPIVNSLHICAPNLSCFLEKIKYCNNFNNCTTFHFLSFFFLIFRFFDIAINNSCES